MGINPSFYPSSLFPWPPSSNLPSATHSPTPSSRDLHLHALGPRPIESSSNAEREGALYRSQTASASPRQIAPPAEHRGRGVPPSETKEVARGTCEEELSSAPGKAHRHTRRSLPRPNSTSSGPLLHSPCLPSRLLLTDKTRIHLRSASVRTYTFFTTGFSRFLSIRGASV
jgi:hypothetical protein